MSERLSVNPDSYSQLPPKLEDLEFVGTVAFHSNRIYRDASSGDTYYQLNNEASPQVQAFVAKLLKGIIPISDVVSIKDAMGKEYFFSKQIHLEDYDVVSTKDEIQACTLLLQYIFNDSDHDIEIDYTHDDNLNARYANGKFVFFDFGAATNFLEFEQHTLPGLLNYVSSEVLGILSNKLLVLKERLDGDTGKTFFDVIHKKTVATINLDGTPYMKKQLKEAKEFYILGKQVFEAAKLICK